MTRLNIISEIPELTYKGIVAMVLVLCPSSSPDYTWTGPRFKSHQGLGGAFLTSSLIKELPLSHVLFSWDVRGASSSNSKGTECLKRVCLI